MKMVKMKIKRKILIPIFAMVFLTILAVANIPPPPVNQNFGIYDTMMVNYNETMCRGCHNSATPSPFVTGGVLTRHHNLVVNSIINPATNQPFICTDCHPSTGGAGVLLDTNCIDCHNGTAFWADTTYGAKVNNISRPHHNSTHAQIRNCKFCHGSSVDDYNDGHYIPTYPVSEVTPNAMFKAYNLTSMRVWGGCLACHAENLLATPQIFYTHTFLFPPIPDGTNNIHHIEILNIDKPSGVTQGDQCLWCHTNISNVFDIRGCETCHSVRAIHNIQVDFANTSTKIGYGHIGSNNPSDPKNNSWDCLGCHAWYNAGVVNPFAGAIIPDVQSATPSVIASGMSTTLTITGDNFVNDVTNADGSVTHYTSNVAVDGVLYTPTSISDSQIVISIPALAAGIYQLQLVKGVDTLSNLLTLTVVPPVTLSSVALNGGNLTINGNGFGIEPQSNATLYISVSDNNGNQIVSSTIQEWSDTQIQAKIPATPGDIVTVMTANGGLAKASIGILPNMATIKPETVTLDIGGSQSFTLAGQISPVWSSSDPTVGTISPTGKFTAIGAGTATISVKNGATSGTATVTVTGIKVTSPNGGENWKRGTAQKIKWTSVGNAGANVKVELLKGKSATTIASSVPNSGSYAWKLPQSVATDYKIRITSTSNKLYTDTSDNNFQISK